MRVMIADDQVLFAGSLKVVLEVYSKGEIEVTGIAHDGDEAVALFTHQRPDVVLMDVRMPGVDGVEATGRILERDADAKIMMLTTFDDDDLVHAALGNGALGYVLKDIEPEELISAIRAVSDGTFLVSAAVGRKLVDRTEDRAGDDHRRWRDRADDLRQSFADLSVRESEVLALVVAHKDNREIADALFIAEQTVKNHISHIYTKLDVTDRLHAIQEVERRCGAT